MLPKELKWRVEAATTLTARTMFSTFCVGQIASQRHPLRSFREDGSFS